MKSWWFRNFGTHVFYEHPLLKRWYHLAAFITSDIIISTPSHQLFLQSSLYPLLHQTRWSFPAASGPRLQFYYVCSCWKIWIVRTATPLHYWTFTFNWLFWDVISFFLFHLFIHIAVYWQIRVLLVEHHLFGLSKLEVGPDKLSV